MTVPFTAILALVSGATDIALAVAELLRGLGCVVHGCPVTVPAEGAAMRAAREAAVRRYTAAEVVAAARGPSQRAAVIEAMARLSEVRDEV